MNLSIKQPVYVAGHRGMVGSAVVRELHQIGCEEIVTRSSSKLDLRDQAATRDFFLSDRPATVVFAAARVGGIHANKSYPADFIYDNLMMAANSIHAAWESGVSRFLFLGSTCIYPRMAEQPIREQSLLTGPLETTNEAYAIAKIAGLKLCQHYRAQHGCMFHSAMPTNLYGPGDNYHPENSHVLPALISRFHQAKINDDKQVVIWGSGRPRREFLHVDDLARATVHLLRIGEPANWYNVGTGIDVSIAELAQMVAAVVGYSGDIVQDPSKPDGTPVKCTDITLLKSTGWTPGIELAAGLKTTYLNYLDELQGSGLRKV